MNENMNPTRAPAIPRAPEIFSNAANLPATFAISLAFLIAI